MAYSAAPFSFSAAQTLSEVTGMSMFRTSACASASITALTYAAGEPTGAPLQGRDVMLTVDNPAAAVAAAFGGHRAVVFVTGEAGIGKTTLIDRFVDRMRDEHNRAPLVGGIGAAVMILTDDQRFDTLRYMPNVRHDLMAQGEQFTQAFVSNPPPTPL